MRAAHAGPALTGQRFANKLIFRGPALACRGSCSFHCGFQLLDGFLP